MPSERIQRQIDALLDAAETAVTRGDWVTVRDRAQAVLRVDPANEDAQHFLKMGGEASGQPSPAPTPSTERAAALPPGVDPKGTPALPVSFASGRYVVKKFLGEGGKKKVYLAHDGVLDRDVAFALIKTEGLDEAARTRVTREAQAMGRLGDHPNIMPIFDLGQEKDPATGTMRPYMVIPLMRGGDVEGVIEDAPEHRVPLERAVQLAKDTANGLVFAHSKGIVHRDLKPGNVWLSADGTPRIGDFGLAVATDKTRLTREGMMVGTVAYMPPEQAMGGDITPRADLYSLGAMLYEMVTGRPPFLGDDDIAIIGQHINTPPVAPTWHRPDCPKTLDSLIMRLLAKDPKQRPESARDVLAALEAIDLKAAIPSTPKADGEGDRGRSLDSVSSGVFVGRQKEMDQLRAALEETLSGHGRMVTLVGEPGIGKTRTAEELATYAGLRRAQTLWGRCYEGGGAPPYWPWVQAIRSYVRERNPEELRREMGSTASVIAEVVTDVKERLHGLQPPPQLESPESARFRLFDSITAFLKTASKTQPIVLVLDDLHWSDKPSLLLLEFVARELANSRLLVIGTYRDMELNRKHPLSVTLGDLIRERLFERVLLRGLQKDDVDRFIEMAAGIKPPPGLVDAVYTQTEGNPLFVTEVVRLLVQEGHLARHSERSEESRSGDGALRSRQAGTQGWGKTGTHSTSSAQAWTVRIPEGVREVIGRRLDRLSDRCNDVLTTAAVIGRQFSLAALVKLYSDPTLSADERLSEDRLLEHMEEALAARIIEELPSGPGRYQFTHALMQETLTSELSTTRKVRLHARIGLALEAMYGKEAASRAAELVQHFAEAESLLGPEKVVEYSLVAGRQALLAYAPHDAEVHFSRGLAAKGDVGDREKADLLFGLGQSLVHTLSRAETHRALTTLREAMRAYESLGLKAEAVKVALTYVPPIRSLSGRMEMIEAALPLVADGSAEQGELISEHATWVNWERADYETAKKDLDRALEIARASGNRPLEFRTQAGAHIIHSSNFMDDLAQTALAEALRLSASVNEPEVKAMLLFGASVTALVQCEFDAAEKYASEILEIGKRLKTSHLTTTGYFALAGVAAAQGDWARARRITTDGLEIDANESRLLASRSIVEFLTGEFEKGREFLEHLARTARASPGSGTVEHLSFANAASIAAVVSGQTGHEKEAVAFCRAAIANPQREPFAKRLAAVSIGRFAMASANLALAKEFLDVSHGNLRLAPDWPMPYAWRHVVVAVTALTGDFPTAIEQLSGEADRFRKMGARPALAYVLFDLADTLVNRDGPGDVPAASKANDEALAIARDLGMKPLIERILRRREILKA